jgi:hypothetical protein
VSGTPVSHKKRHHSKSRVSHHTVHLSVMDGAVRMTASQSQASSKRMHRTGAFCSVPEIKTTSTCKPEKTKAVARRGNELVTLRRSSAALVLTFVSLALGSSAAGCRASARRRNPLNSASLVSFLSGFPSRIQPSTSSRADWKNCLERQRPVPLATPSEV